MRLLHPPAAPARARRIAATISRSSTSARHRAPTVPRACVRARKPLRFESGRDARSRRAVVDELLGEVAGVTTVDRDRRGHHRRARVRRRRARARRSALAYREFPQHFPQPGWVEHDADDIWRVTLETLAEVVSRSTRRARRRRDRDHEPARDRVVWDRRDGRATPPRDRVAGPTHRRALRRRCAPPGHEPLIRRQTGLGARPVLLGDEAGVAAARRRRRRPTPTSLFGTVDTWILWNLTGGVERRRARDRSVEREPHDAVRHRHARLVRRAVRAVRRTARVPAGGAAVERPLRHDDARVRGRVSRFR